MGEFQVSLPNLRQQVLNLKIALNQYVLGTNIDERHCMVSFLSL